MASAEQPLRKNVSILEGANQERFLDPAQTRNDPPRSRKGAIVETDVETILQSGPSTQIVYLRGAAFLTEEIEQIQELIRCLQQHRARQVQDPRMHLLGEGPDAKFAKMETSFFSVLQKLLKDALLEEDHARRSSYVDRVYTWFKEKNGEHVTARSTTATAPADPEFDALLTRAGYTVIPNATVEAGARGATTATAPAARSVAGSTGAIAGSSASEAEQEHQRSLQPRTTDFDGVSTRSGESSPAPYPPPAPLFNFGPGPAFAGDRLRMPNSVYGGGQFEPRRLMPFEPQRLVDARSALALETEPVRAPNATIHYSMKTAPELLLNKAHNARTLEAAASAADEYEHAQENKVAHARYKTALTAATTHRLALRDTYLYDRLKMTKDQNPVTRLGADHQQPTAFIAEADCKFEVHTRWDAEIAEKEQAARLAAEKARRPRSAASAPARRSAKGARKRQPAPPVRPPATLATVHIKQLELAEFQQVQDCCRKWDVLIPVPTLRTALLTPADRPTAELYKALPIPGEKLRNYEPPVGMGGKRKKKRPTSAPGGSDRKPARPSTAASSRPSTRAKTPIRNIVRS